ncbi:PEGA domain-containing protein, partial [bacterium]|nr:PEGA domain-containing protein [bacterium]
SANNPDSIYVLGETIDTSETWVNNGATYVIGSNVFVKGTDTPTLFIAPNTEIRFARNTGLYIGGSGVNDKGKLIADGSDGTITFTSDQATPTAGYWRSIFFDNYSDDESSLKNVVVECGGYAYNTNIYCKDASPEIQGSIIKNSSAHGIRCNNSSPLIINNIIKDNLFNGIYLENISYPFSATNTITNNIISGNGYCGILCASASPKVYNNIIVQNGTKNSSYYGIRVNSGILTTDYNDVWGNGSPATHNYYNCVIGTHDISVNPQFIGAADFHPCSSSPCIDKGLNTAPAIPSTDKDGNPRIVRIVDMGAYEFQGTPTLQYGSLSITSTPSSGAKIYLDGTDTGSVTTQVFANISAGTHAIKLTLSGYQDWYGTATVIAGSTIDINATLTQVCTFKVNPSITYADGTNTFTVSINAANVLDLHGASFDLVYDAAILCPIKQDIKWAKEGGFLPSNTAGQPTMFIPTISTSTTIGTITVSTSILGTSSGVNGTGTIATIQFEYLDIGLPETGLTLNNVVLKNHLNLDIPFTTSNGTVTQSLIGSLSITSVPFGANIFLDGTDTTQTTPATITDILSGTHAIRLTKSGYLDWLSTITVTSGEIQYVSGTLTMLGDFNGDFYIDFDDMSAFATAWHFHRGNSEWMEQADFNRDGYIDYNDMFAFTAIWNTSGNAMAPVLSAPHITSAVGGYIGVDLNSDTEPMETMRTLSKGDTFTIKVIADRVVDLHGVNFDLVYDAGILCPVKQDGKWAKEGDFLLSNTAGQSTMFIPTISTSTTIGTINVAASILGTNYGVDDTGTIATILFEVIGEGKVVLSFNNVVYANQSGAPTNISDTRGGTVSITSSHTLLRTDFEPNLEQVLVYPNPYYADGPGDGIYFDHLSENATIQIFTIVGELVWEIGVENLLLKKKWEVCNSVGEKVASGIYIYLIKDSSGNRKAGKLAVIR